MSLPARASLSRVLVALLSVLVVPLWCAVQPVSAVTGPSAVSVHRAADYGAMPLLGPSNNLIMRRATTLPL